MARNIYAVAADRALAKTRKQLGLGESGAIMLRAMIAVAMIAALALWGSDDAATDEIVVRAAFIGLIILIFPLLYGWNFFSQANAAWQEKNGELEDIRQAEKKNINVAWRITERNEVDLKITNVSTKTIEGIEVLFANYRDDNESKISDVQCPIGTIDGKMGSIRLNPYAPHYFRIAKLTVGNNGGVRFDLAQSNGIYEARAHDRVVKTKLRISGIDIPAHSVRLCLRVDDKNALTVEPWPGGENAVRPG